MADRQCSDCACTTDNGSGGQEVRRHGAGWVLTPQRLVAVMRAP